MEGVNVKVEWQEDVQPSQEEVKYKVYGLRAEHNGARLEVHVLYTVEDAVHVVWTVTRPHGKLSAKGKVHPIDLPWLYGRPISFDDRAFSLYSAREQAKKRAQAISEAWPL